MTLSRFWLAFSTAAVGGLLFVSGYSQKKPDSLLILNAQIADGTGAPIYKANVRVALGHIVGIGELQPQPGEPTLDAKGLVLAPGFIDIHNHSEPGLPKDLAAETQLSQGITTLIVGADGDSPWPPLSWIRMMQDHPAAVNVGLFAGHATIRQQILGDDFKRTSTAPEIRQMEARMSQAMNQGVLGLSSGLEYEVGSYASTDEMVALAKVAAADGGIYMTHIRDEADKSFEALKEEKWELGRMNSEKGKKKERMNRRKEKMEELISLAENKRKAIVKFFLVV